MSEFDEAFDHMPQKFGGMSFEDYRALPGLNFSLVKHMATSPRHYQNAMANGTLSTKAMETGRVIHTAALEPFDWMSRYEIRPEKIERKKMVGRGKDKRETVELITPNSRTPELKALEAECAARGKEMISKGDHDTAVSVSRAMQLDPVAASLLRKSPKTEVVVRWERMGLQMKSRLDMAHDDFCADLKKVNRIDLQSIYRSCVNYEYAAQFACYADAWAAVTGKAVPFYGIFVEDKQPHDVVVIRFTEEDLEYGRQRYESWLSRIVECSNSNEWPGVAGGKVVESQLPRWGDEDEIEADEEEVA